MEDMAMHLVRRRKLNGQDGNELYDGPPELIARKSGLEWHSRKGFSELNHDFFIGVRNKKTDTIQLFEVEGMYSLRPFVRRSRVAREDMHIDDEDPKTYAEQRSELLKTFGGTRSLRKVEKYEKDRITDEKVDDKAQMQVTEAAKGLAEKDAAQGIFHSRDSTTESMAPPHDSSATTPEAAYPLEGLITPGELAALEQEASSMITSCAEVEGPPENPGWHPLVWHALEKVATNSDISSSARVRRLQAAMHLHYLIELGKCSKIIGHRVQGQLMESMAVDDGVLNCLLERFTVPYAPGQGKPTVWRKTQADTSRLVVYAIIMWVTACGFKNCDKLEALAEALGVSIRLLLTCATQIGCKLRRKSAQNVPQEYRIYLKVPLVFPPIRKRKGTPQKRS